VTVGVPPALQGRRLDQALTVLFPALTRTHLKELIQDGHVRVAGVLATKPGAPVESGTSVEVAIAARRNVRVEAPDASTLRVLHEDEAIIVIDKPPGVLAHRTDTVSGATISDLAVLRYGALPALQGDDRPGIVHRLDAGTSGVMVLARTEDAFRDLMRQFRDRHVAKIYLALVYGEPRFDTGWISTPIDRAEGDTSRMRTVESGAGRPAQTYYEVRERIGGLALLVVQPKTGRTHQIRVHLGSIGLPLVGDKRYKRKGGHSLRLPGDAPIPGRQCLHATELRFRHPLTRAEVRYEAPLHDDFARMLAWAREKLV